MWLLANWKLVVIGVLSVFMTVGLFYISTLKSDLKLEESARKTAEANFQQCQSDAIKSKEISSEFQKSNTALKSQLNRLRSQSKCIVPNSRGGYNGTSTGRELSGSDGISSGWLYEFAGRAEETRLKLLGCQKFVSEVCQK